MRKCEVRRSEGLRVRKLEIVTAPDRHGMVRRAKQPRGRSVAVTLVLLTAATLAAAPLQLLPVDEAYKRPDFFSFRAQLQRAIAMRDTTALLAAVDPNIKNSFGGNDGLDEFKTMWKIGQPDSGIWEELGTVLSMGGSFFDEHTFVAPYVFSKWPESVDSFEHIAIVGANVRVRSEPKPDAPPIDAVSFVILPVASDARVTDEAWRAVKIESRVGFVSSRFARSPIDYRAIFSGQSGQWRLVTFVAGD